MQQEPCFEDFGDVFGCLRVRSAGELPQLDPKIIDIAVLDMHHDWPNLGHDSLVRAVGEIAHDLAPLLAETGLAIRTISYDVRGRCMIPDAPGDRHRIYIGTGGPGHLDPRLNDGVSEESQGIREDASWEQPAFRLFDAIRDDSGSALLGVCHSFGVLCRWAGVAQPVLRGAEKGGKSSGVRENCLTREALVDSWFSRFSRHLREGRRLRVLDSRLFDLIPGSAAFPAGVKATGFELNAGTGLPDDAVTMIDFAASGAAIPRMFAVNHHPEIRDRGRQVRLLNVKLSRGEVSREWYEERVRSLEQIYATPESEQDVMVTSQYTLLGPLRYHIYRQVRIRASEAGYATTLHEDQVLQLASGILDREQEPPPQ